MSSFDLHVVRHQLDNGLRIVCVPQPKLHAAAVTLHLRVGSRFEADVTNGLSHLLEHMLYRGTRSFATAHAQAQALERLGATLYAATHTDHGVMGLAVPPENLPQAFAILAEITTSPRFSALEIERGIIREEILESLDDDGHQIDPDNLSRALMYPGHSLGTPITGTTKTLDSFVLADLHAHHRRHYTGENTVLCFAGAIDPNGCADAAARYLEQLPKGTRCEALPPPREQAAPRVRWVQNQGSQTDLRLSFRAPGEQNAAEAASAVLVRLLDDGMSTRLYARICDELGLCYDVWADYETFEDDGVIDLAAAVQHARAPRVMREMIGVVKRLARDGPSDEELRTCQDRYRWEMQALLDDAEGLADFHATTALRWTSDTLEARGRQIAEVTREQVVEVARAIFRPERLSAVAVGAMSRADRRVLEQVVGEF